MSDWNNFGQWADNGALTATQRANGIWKQVLNDYVGPSMDSARTDTLNDFIARARQKVARLSIEPGTVLPTGQRQHRTG